MKKEGKFNSNREIILRVFVRDRLDGLDRVRLISGRMLKSCSCVLLCSCVFVAFFSFRSEFM